jgi:hypothetical protein
MSPLRERLAFVATLAALVVVFLNESLLGGKILSPADVVYAQASFRDATHGALYEPRNRLLIDPVLQFQPWLEFNRAMLRRGRLPLWNPLVGCGAPHLANGQSAVFDPFHAIAYLGRLPDAFAWMAAARLCVAGLGIFLLAERWGLGRWGRWFAGLTFPFSGFLIVWLQFPVTSVAVWMPWLLLASDAVLSKPTGRNIAFVSLVAACALLGGHIQTSAHVLLAAGVYATWWSISSRGPSGRIGGRDRLRLAAKPLLAWSAGMALGVGVAAVEVVPLGFYLTKSPVWSDRAAERPSIVTVERPRMLDAACTGLPYLYGSQRRGQPNLAKALRVHNLNESAGGFAGLATLIWLAPLGIGSRHPRARFLAGLIIFGGLAAFAIPPIANALRIIPVLNVADNRRLSLWVAFGLALLGGIGLDRLVAWRPGPIGRIYLGSWVLAALGLLAGACLVARLEPALRARALEHAAQTADQQVSITSTPDSLARAERQVRQSMRFVPRYFLLSSAHLLIVAIVAARLGRGGIELGTARSLVLVTVLCDLFAFGYGLNPAISRADDRPTSPVIDYLTRQAAPPARIVSVGAELPPNILMRYGLADVRNYDSVEVTRSLKWFEPLYERGRNRTSRRGITWEGVTRALDRLEGANVSAVVAASPPPTGVFDRVDRVGNVWIARLSWRMPLKYQDDAGQIDVNGDALTERRLVVPQTFDPGWRAEIDGQPAAIESEHDMFLAVRLPLGAQRVRLVYDPPEVRGAVAISLTALATSGLLLGVSTRAWGRRKTFRGAWSARNDRVRIDSRDLRRNFSPASHCTEGRDADGPLHV